MPKATKDHRSKKNPQSHEAWRRRNAANNAADTTKKLEQKYWRKDALEARIENRLPFTEKNLQEGLRVGVFSGGTVEEYRQEFVTE